MIWCDCGEFILDFEIDDFEYDHKLGAPLLHDKPMPQLQLQDLSDLDDDTRKQAEILLQNHKCVRLNPVFVTRVVGTNMEPYAASRPMTVEEVERFDRGDRSFDFVRKYDTWAEGEENMNHSEEQFNLSVPCNSYNIADTKANIDLRHDGCYVHAEYKDKDGSLKKMTYWGD